MRMHTTDKHRELLFNAGLWTNNPNEIDGLAPPTKRGKEVCVREIVAEYNSNQDENVFCYVCGRKNHKNGFLAITAESDRILVGNCCAKEISDERQLETARQFFKTKKSAVHYELATREIIEKLPWLTEELEALGHYCKRLDVARGEVIELLGSNASEVRTSLRENHGRLVVVGEVEDLIQAAQTKKGDSRDDTKIQRSWQKIFDQPCFGNSYIRKKDRVEVLCYEIELDAKRLCNQTSFDSKKKLSNREFLSDYRSKVRDKYSLLEEKIADATRFLSPRNLKNLDKFIQLQYVDPGHKNWRMPKKTGTFFAKAIQVKNGLPKQPLTPILDNLLPKSEKQKGTSRAFAT